MNEETNYHQFWRGTVIAMAVCIVIVWIPLFFVVARSVKSLSGGACL